MDLDDYEDAKPSIDANIIPENEYEQLDQSGANAMYSKWHPQKAL